MLLATIVLGTGIALLVLAGLILMVAPDPTRRRVRETIMALALIGVLFISVSIQSFILTGGI